MIWVVGDNRHAYECVMIDDVVCREQGDDGFIITALLTSKARSLAKRRQVWP